MKKKTKAITPESEAADWRKLAGTYREAKADFDFASIYATDEAIDADAASHGLTRDEAENWLKKKELSNREQQLVLGRAFDKAPTRQLAATTGKSKSWVAAQLKRGTIKRAIEKLQSGKILPVLSTDQQATRAIESGRTLALQRCAGMARGVVSEGAFGGRVEWDEESYTKWGVPLAVQITFAIRQGPATLLDEKNGKRWLEALVDLLEAAKLGDSMRRVPGVVPKGTRQQVRAAARKALLILTKQIRGKPFEFKVSDLWLVVFSYRRRLSELRTEWRASTEAIPVRLETMRTLHAKELTDFTEKELRSVLQGDPFDTLDVACRLAEKATSVSAETWKRVWNGWRVFDSLEDRRVIDEARYQQLLKQALKS